MYVLYRFANVKMVLEKLYEEVSNLLTETQFEELYKHATSEPHDALVIDTHPKMERDIYQFTKPAHRADQAAFAHTMKAPAPSLSLGGGLIYSPRCCTWDQIEHSPASHRGAFERVPA